MLPSKTGNEQFAEIFIVCFYVSYAVKLSPPRKKGHNSDRYLMPNQPTQHQHRTSKIGNKMSKISQRDL